MALCSPSGSPPAPPGRTRRLRAPGTLLLLLAFLALLVGGPHARAQEPPGPATRPQGVWEGQASGEGPLVPEGEVAFALALRPAEEGLEARLTLDDQALPWATASWSAEASELRFEGRLQGVAIAVEGRLEGEGFRGQATALGAHLVLAGERVAREVPADVVEAPAQAAAPAVLPLDALSVADWLADLRALGEELPRRHANAFHAVTRAEWEAAVAELHQHLPELDPLECLVALARLGARIGDAHTGLGWNSVPGLSPVPVHLRYFSDGLFVTAVHEDFADLLAGRVVALDGRPVEEVAAALESTFAAENRSWVRAQLEGRLPFPGLLHGAGVADSASSLAVRVEADGEEIELTLEPRSGGAWVLAPDPALDEVPEWQRDTGRNYRYLALPGTDALYLAYNRCTEDPAAPMAAFFEAALQAFDEAGARRLVVDLRHNSGGNSAILTSQIPRLLAHPVLSRPGRVLVLVGPVTYSSAMMNAYQLRELAGARLLGQPTGGKPNSYGEVRSFALPRSGLPVYYSTKFFRLLPDEDPPAVLPDVTVEPSSADHFAGRDPVLEAALELPLPDGSAR